MIFSVGDKKYYFKEESFGKTVGELIDIILQNHEETGVYEGKVRPDFERLVDLENSGNLKLILIRLDYQVVGYSIFFIDQHVFQSDVLVATQGVTFIYKEHRGIGLAFIKFCDDILKKQGINSVWRQASEKFDVGPVYERLGYKLIEKSYLRRL